MKKNSVVTKLGIVIMLLFLSILIPFAILIDRIFLNVYSLYLDENVRALGDRIEVAIIETMKDDPNVYSNIESLTDHNLAFFDKNGFIQSEGYLEYHKGSKISEDWLSRIQVEKYLAGERVIPETEENIYYIVKPFMKDGNLSGGVIIFSSISEIHDKMHAVRDWIIRTILGAIILALGYTIFLSWRLSRPLVEMEKATREIAKGNLKTKVNVPSSDEIGSLAKAINDLSVELNDYRTNRSEFLANISHELRTPTSYLKGYGEIIKNKRYETPEELEKYASIIESEANRLAKLIQELFELSKMEEGSFQLYRQYIDIEDLVESIVEKVNLKVNNTNNRIILCLQPNLPDIYTDGLRLEQILMNLVENAVHYSEDGDINIQVCFIEKQIQFIVRDEGPGIPQEDLPFIFNRFHRVEKSRARNLGGSGLGLAIVSELTKHLYGEIDVQSSIGKGTTFTLSLPIDLPKN
ncbi:HAMP domain-containing sensor histidine kinase [Solibacillus sp. FSL R7-0668]|uniref:sensor histidine kinase n=1 Tax=Solibacillus sp. FSL R7-0668 TaxID=2921688 RepID=UPI0030F51C56